MVAAARSSGLYLGGRGPRRAAPAKKTIYPRLSAQEESEAEQSDEDEEGGKTSKQKKEPGNRAELYAQFKGRGPVAMVRSFLEGRRLQYVAIIICHVSEPLEAQFFRDQGQQCKGAFREWAVQRCRAVDGAWWSTVRELLEAPFDMALAERLGHTQVSTKRRTKALLEEQKLSTAAADFGVRLASNHFWANAQYRWTLPHAMPVYLFPDDQDKKNAATMLRNLVKTVVKAEGRLNSAGTNKALRQMMADVGWHKQQFARELMAYILRQGTDHNSPDLAQLAEKMVGASHSTWGVLESAFSYLRFRSQSQGKSDKLADFTRYCYSILNPYAEEAGLPQFLPDMKDWVRCFSPEHLEERRMAEQKLASANHTTMPRGTTPTEIYAENRDHKWKLAGPLAHQRSSAAGMWLYGNNSRMNPFAHASSAWTCVLASYIPAQIFLPNVSGLG